MTATVRYHHKGLDDDLVIAGYAGDDPNTGVVLLSTPAGELVPELASEIEPWPTAGGAQ